MANTFTGQVVDIGDDLSAGWLRALQSELTEAPTLAAYSEEIGHGGHTLMINFDGARAVDNHDSDSSSYGAALLTAEQASVVVEGSKVKGVFDAEPDDRAFVRLLVTL